MQISLQGGVRVRQHQAPYCLWLLSKTSSVAKGKTWGTNPGSGQWRADCTQLKHCSKPCWKISLGKSIPMNTILLVRFSPGAQA